MGKKIRFDACVLVCLFVCQARVYSFELCPKNFELLGFYMDFTQILHGFYEDFTWILQRFYMDFTQILPTPCKAVSQYTVLFRSKNPITLGLAVPIHVCKTKTLNFWAIQI